MPYRLPRNRMEQAEYNRRLQARFNATRRTAPAAPASVEQPRDPIAALRELGELHDSGMLNDDEFAAAKAKLIAADGP
jgi:hypothetical protein